MTNMRRVTVSLTDELNSAIKKIRKQKDFENASDSEIIRHLMRCGLVKCGLEERGR